MSNIVKAGQIKTVVGMGVYTIALRAINNRLCLVQVRYDEDNPKEVAEAHDECNATINYINRKRR